MRKIFFITLLFFLFTNCKTKHNLSGIWWRVDEDDVYYELHANKNDLAICNSATGGCTYDYKISKTGDTLNLVYKGKIKKTYKYEIRKDSLLFSTDSNRFIFYKLSQKTNYFEIENNNKPLDKYLYNFKLRSQRKLDSIR